MGYVQNRLRSEPAFEAADDLVDTLLACHARTREHIGISMELGRAFVTAARPAWTRDAARRVRRFLSGELPLHQADEDVSIAPRLWFAAAPDEVVEALGLARRQHGLIARSIECLRPLWKAIEEDPTRLPMLSRALELATERLSAFWAPHLALEETTILPAVRELLGPSDAAAIRTEMRERRGALPSLFDARYCERPML